MIILTGNGFNYMINSFIRNNQGYYSEEYGVPKEQTSNLADEISEITSLWKEFDKFFKKLIENYPEMTHEELIRMINSVLEFLNNSEKIREIVPDCSDSISKLKTGMEEVIGEKILEICKKFRDFESNRNHSLIKRIFPDFGQKIRGICSEKSDTCLYITTNYDGIKDTLFSYEGYINDGFGYDSYRNLVFTEDNFKSNQLLLHVHGSYKFQKGFYETIKLTGTRENKNPLMIFNQPELKEKQIKADNVLNEYFKEFKRRLEQSDRLVIVGNSLINEPHIISAIDYNFNRTGNEIHIYDASPENVKKILEKNIKKRKFDIKTVSTLEFVNEQDFFDSLKENI